MTPVEKLLAKYVQSVEKVFTEIKLSRSGVNIEPGKTGRVVDRAKRYFEDAKYYREKKRDDVGLASIAYSEGVLDALKLLDLVEFQWPMKKKEGTGKNGRNRTVVLASGTFDLLHLGHVKYLEEAKKAGGRNSELIVVVARDKTVEKRKGKRAVLPEDHRRALVEALKVVDAAILGFEDFSISDVIEKIRPDLIAVGYDQEGVESAVKKAITEQKVDVHVKKIGKFGKKELNSSSKIRRRIVESFKRS